MIRISPGTRRLSSLLLRCATGMVGLSLLISLGLAWSVSSIGNDVRGCLIGCAHTAELNETAFKLITLNVYHGFPRFRNVRGRVDLIAQRLRKVHPDFVLLQEVPWRSDVGWAAEYLARHVGLNFVYVRGNGNSRSIRFEEGLAILSRYPLRDPRFRELSPRNGIFEHRIALAVIAETHSGPIQLVTAHLAWDKTNRINAGQLASLEAFVGELEIQPTILAGDFNAHEEAPQIKKLSAHWVDAYRDVHKHAQSLTCCLPPQKLDKADAGQHFARVDYVFLRGSRHKGWATLDAKPIFDRPFKTLDGYQWASNHAGVLVEANLFVPH